MVFLKVVLGKLFKKKTKVANQVREGHGQEEKTRSFNKTVIYEHMQWEQ